MRDPFRPIKTNEINFNILTYIILIYTYITNITHVTDI